MDWWPWIFCNCVKKVLYEVPRGLLIHRAGQILICSKVCICSHDISAAVASEILLLLDWVAMKSQLNKTSHPSRWYRHLQTYVWMGGTYISRCKAVTMTMTLTMTPWNLPQKIWPWPLTPCPSFDLVKIGEGYRGWESSLACPSSVPSSSCDLTVLQRFPLFYWNWWNESGSSVFLFTK